MIGATLLARSRSPRAVAVLLIVLLLLGAGGWWLYRQFTHVFVDDARVAADMLSLSSRVPGWVTEVRVIEGDSAPAGSLLVAIDSRDSRLQLAQIEAQLAGIVSRRAEIEARIRMTDHDTANKIAAQEAAIRVAQARQAAVIAQRDFARQENQRSEKLAPLGGLAQARLDQTRADLESAEQQVKSARADLENAHALLAQAKAAREELAVLERQLAELGPQADDLEAQRQRMLIDLADRRIVMPFAGVVDQRFVDPGEYVSAGQRLLMVHDPQAVRVEANVKETDIRFFKPGKAVEVRVDALPGEVFEGVVERVSHAATSEFALLPNPNPSGNFTKITQRLPVRIRVRQRDGLLKPGMMVELEARARE
jgi:membrane fusion protein (multidrug efflux system)